MRSEGYSSWVCVSVMSHFTYGASIHPKNAVMYSAGNEVKKICGDLPETTVYKSYAMLERELSTTRYSYHTRCSQFPHMCMGIIH